jgi:hypothetical protein
MDHLQRITALSMSNVAWIGSGKSNFQLSFALPFISIRSEHFLAKALSQMSAPIPGGTCNF